MPNLESTKEWSTAEAVDCWTYTKIGPTHTHKPISYQCEQAQGKT